MVASDDRWVNGTSTEYYREPPISSSMGIGSRSGSEICLTASPDQTPSSSAINDSAKSIYTLAFQPTTTLQKKTEILTRSWYFCQWKDVRMVVPCMYMGFVYSPTFCFQFQVNLTFNESILHHRTRQK